MEGLSPFRARESAKVDLGRMRVLALLVALFYVPAVVVWFILHYVHPVQG
jgi:hypothetical protein